MKKHVILVTSLALMLVPLGCSPDASRPASNAAASGDSPALDGSKYLSTEAPRDAVDVIQARESARNGQEIVVIGRIGGSKTPWIAGRAAFSIVDRSIKACTDISGDNCPTPWDYCCQTDLLPTATALVKIVDSQGSLVKVDARQLLSVKELSTVIVKGTAIRDTMGNLTVLAKNLYVEP